MQSTDDVAVILCVSRESVPSRLLSALAIRTVNLFVVDFILPNVHVLFKETLTEHTLTTSAPWLAEIKAARRRLCFCGVLEVTQQTKSQPDQKERHHNARTEYAKRKEDDNKIRRRDFFPQQRFWRCRHTSAARSEQHRQAVRAVSGTAVLHAWPITRCYKAKSSVADKASCSSDCIAGFFFVLYFQEYSFFFRLVYEPQSKGQQGYNSARFTAMNPSFVITWRCTALIVRLFSLTRSISKSTVSTWTNMTPHK